MSRAKIALAQAEVNLDNAKLVAPIDGTVATMPFTVGHSMTTSETVSIVGSGSVRLSITVPETSVALVKVGQSAKVSVSAGAASTGRVTSIGILPSDSSTSSTASYPVVVTVPRPTSALAPGVTAAASITVSSATKALVVPVSAVTKTTDTTGTVTTLDADNTSKTVQVQLGATGSTTVQVVSGLTAGQRIVLADNTQALPTSNTSTTRARSTGGFGAGATGGAGGAGGVPPGAGGGTAPGGR